MTSISLADHSSPADRHAGLLPPDDVLRVSLHNEIHARPQAHIRLPALITYVAVLNRDVSREQECAHLSRLPGQQDLAPQALQGNFLRLRLGGYTVKWERHSEFTRYSIVQPLPEGAGLGAAQPALLDRLATPLGWLAEIPGQTIAALQLVMLEDELIDASGVMQQAAAWFGPRSTLVASEMGRGHSWAITDFRLQGDGFERLLVLFRPGGTLTRAGRVAGRLIELETYRLMALRGLPVAKSLGPTLASVEAELADLTAQLDSRAETEQHLLDRLIALAARVERTTAEHGYRFSATRAYADLVEQRISELREQSIPGNQTVGEFLRRRVSPAIATVSSTERRLAALSGRIARTSDLLRTRVDIVTEGQNQQLLEKLTRGQELQLRLQTTVEGLSIAAISYYVVSLLLYGAKALKGLGVPLQPEMTAGALIPVVLWGVWRTTRRIHEKLHAGH
ncbi:MAG: hypothetical protein RJA36_2672 [Pseudomonadota bacterium]|jgi:uncharacterized membrane-anchored protein